MDVGCWILGHLDEHNGTMTQHSQMFAFEITKDIHIAH